ncbi:hypothetical protein CPB97_006207, partial [Podila verticillata]
VNEKLDATESHAVANENTEFDAAEIAAVANKDAESNADAEFYVESDAESDAAKTQAVAVENAESAKADAYLMTTKEPFQEQTKWMIGCFIRLLSTGYKLDEVRDILGEPPEMLCFRIVHESRYEGADVLVTLPQLSLQGLTPLPLF